MPTVPHTEKHFTGTPTVRDIVIGMSDGLTVPFALAAGLAGAVGSNSIIVTAGMAEIAAGSIAMGLGGYLAAKTDIEHYSSELAREVRETHEIPAEEEKEVAEVFRGFGLSEEQIGPVVAAISSEPNRWVEFMMRFELGLERPDPRRASRSALTIGAAYIAGGLIPLAPYMALRAPFTALGFSVGITVVALLIFGYVKGVFTGMNPLRGSLQTAFVGGLAAAAAYTIARFFA